MAQQYIEIVAKATLAGSVGGSKNIANVFHFRRVSTANPFNKTNVEAAFQGTIMAAVLLASSQDYVQAGTTVRLLDDATDPPQTFAETGPGVIATDRLPGFDSVVVQLKTAIKGKSGRGSKHFAGIPEIQTTQNILTGTGPTLWGAVRDAMIAGFADIDGNVWVLGINSHKAPAQWLVNPVVLVWNDVTAGLLNLTLGTMRRRKVRTVN